MLLDSSFFCCVLLPSAFAAVVSKPSIITLPTDDTPRFSLNASSPHTTPLKLPLPPPPRAPHMAPIPFTSTSVVFSHYGRSIDHTLATSVIGQATAWLATKLEADDDHSIVPARTTEFPRGPRWTSHNIRLYIRPGPRMDWSHLVQLMFQVYKFVTSYKQVEFRAEMTDVRGEIIGTADMRYVDGPMRANDTPLLGFDGIGNGTKVGGGELADVPPDPSIFKVRDSGMTIKLRNVGKAILALDVVSCVIQALFDAIQELVSEGGDTYISRDLAWTWQHAMLNVFPSRLMTYGDLATALKGILSFLNAYGYWVLVHMDFLDERRGSIGVATLIYV